MTGVDEPRAVPPPPPDPDLGAEDLFHREASTSLLTRYLEPRGFEFLDARVIQALYRPTRTATVRFRVKARTGAGAQRMLSMCLRRRAAHEEPVVPPADFGRRFGIDDPVEIIDGATVWTFPYDPVLASLPDGAHGPTVRDAGGIRRPSAVSVTPLRYRPGQRAAFRYTAFAPDGHRETLYGKVVGEDAFARIFDAYESYANTGIPMVEPRAATGLEGVALFPTIEGECLRDRIEQGGSLPDPDRLVGLLETLAQVRWLGDPEPPHNDMAIRSAGRLLAHLLPHRRQEIRELYRMLAGLAARPLPELFTVHGDLYEGQIFVGKDYSLGLIDLEDGGPGDPLMDAANMLAHLMILHVYTPEADGRPLAYRALLRRKLLDHLGGGEEELLWREAACALMLATGPFRVQSPRWPQETEARLYAVQRLLGRGLTQTRAA